MQKTCDICFKPTIQCCDNCRKWICNLCTIRGPRSCKSCKKPITEFDVYKKVCKYCCNKCTTQKCDSVYCNDCTKDFTDSGHTRCDLICTLCQKDLPQCTHCKRGLCKDCSYTRCKMCESIFCNERCRRDPLVNCVNCNDAICIGCKSLYFCSPECIEDIQIKIRRDLLTFK